MAVGGCKPACETQNTSATEHNGRGENNLTMLIEKKHIDEKTEIELTVDKYGNYNLLVYTTENANAPTIDNSNIIVNRDYPNEHAARRAMARYIKKLSEV